MRFSKKPNDSLTSSHFYWIIYGQTLLWNLNFTKKNSEIVLQHTTATTQRATWLLYLCKWAKKSWEFKKPKYIKNDFFSLLSPLWLAILRVWVALYLKWVIYTLCSSDLKIIQNTIFGIFRSNWSLICSGRREILCWHTKIFEALDISINNNKIVIKFC